MGSLGKEASQNTTQLSGLDAWMDGGGLHWGGQQERKTRFGGGIQEGEKSHEFSWDISGGGALSKSSRQLAVWVELRAGLRCPVSYVSSLCTSSTNPLSSPQAQSSATSPAFCPPISHLPYPQGESTYPLLL